LNYIFDPCAFEAIAIPQNLGDHTRFVGTLYLESRDRGLNLIAHLEVSEPRNITIGMSHSKADKTADGYNDRACEGERQGSYDLIDLYFHNVWF